MAGFSAKNARVQIGATNLPAKSWTVNTTADELDITHFETTSGDNTYSDVTTGIKSADISCECIWDAVQNPHNNPPNIQVGSVLTNVKFYLDKVNLAVFWNFPYLVVTNVSVQADVRGIVSYNFTAKTKGPYSYPT